MLSAIENEGLDYALNNYYNEKLITKEDEMLAHIINQYLNWRTHVEKHFMAEYGESVDG